MSTNFIQKFRAQKWIVLFVIYLRYLIGGAMIFSSIVKIEGKRFTSANGSHEPINSAFHLFETLYQSGLYWNFLGWSQLIVGAVLMTQYYATFGALSLLPITLNIFVITISYYFAYTPVITGLLLLANIFLIIWDYDIVAHLFPNSKKFIASHSFYCRVLEKRRFWIYQGFLLLIITIIFVLVNGRAPFIWFMTCLGVGLTGLIYFLKNLYQ